MIQPSMQYFPLYSAISPGCSFSRFILYNSITIIKANFYEKLSFILYELITNHVSKFVVFSVLSRNLHPCWQGSIIYHCGLQSSLTTSLIHTELNMPKFLINLTVGFSQFLFYLLLNQSFKVILEVKK